MTPGLFPRRNPVVAQRVLRLMLGRVAGAEVLRDLRELAWYREQSRGPLRARLYFAAEVARHTLRAVAAGWAAEHVADGDGAGLRGWAHDTRQAAKMLARNPTHAAITVATLGVSIGAVAVVFSLINMLLFAPLPFEDPDRLVTLHDLQRGPGRPEVAYTPRGRSLETLRELMPDLAIAGHRFGTVRVDGGSEPTQSIGVRLTDAWFETLGVRPAVGRGFTREEQRAGTGANVAVIGHDLWARAFGRDPSVVGRSVMLNGRAHVVVGVMPPGFRYPWGAQVWQQSELDPTATFTYGTVARLPEELDIDAFNALLADASAQAARMYPELYSEVRFDARSLREYLVDNRAGVAWVLLASVAMLLVLACANVAGLSTVRVLGQERELAIRAALGCGRGRLFRLVFLEGALLALVGGVAGIATALLVEGRLASLGSASQSGVGLLLSIRMDHRVIAFTCLATGMAAILASTLPAVRALGTAHSMALTRSRGSSEQRGTTRLLSGAVFAQATIGATLLIVSAAVAQSYLRLEATDRGYQRDDRRAIRVVLPDEQFPEGEGRWQRLDEIGRQLRESAEVVAAGYTHHLPMTPGNWPRHFTFEATAGGREVAGNVNARWVGPSYFDAMGMSLIAGRTLSVQEMEQGAAVAVISAGVAERFDDNPAAAVGQRVKMGLRDDDRPWLQIVGVVEQAHEEWSFAESLYLPYSRQQHSWVEMVVHVRPGTADSRLGEIVRSIDPDQPVDDIRALAALQSEELRAERLTALIAGALALGGLTITLLGTYGLVSFRVRRQRRELGVRMALGCDAPRLAWHVVSRGVALVGVGVVASLVVTFATIRPLLRGGQGAADYTEVQLFTEGLALSPASTSGALLLIVTTATIACLIPVLRALGADPLRVLRED